MNKTLIYLTLLMLLFSGCSKINRGAKEIAETVISKSSKNLDDVIKTTSKVQYRAVSKKIVKKLSKNGFRTVEAKSGALKIYSKNSDELLGIIRHNQITCTPGYSSKTTNLLLQDVKYLPNFTYKVDNFIYKTDKLGRVSEVQLSRISRSIKRYEGTYSHFDVVNQRNGIKGIDDAGHLIARQLGGPSEMINYVPQNGSLNKGKWRVLEQKVMDNSKYIKDYTIKLSYDRKSLRPKFMQMSFYNKGVYEVYNFVNHTI